MKTQNTSLDTVKDKVIFQRIGQSTANMNKTNYIQVLAYADGRMNSRQKYNIASLECVEQLVSQCCQIKDRNEDMLRVATGICLIGVFCEYRSSVYMCYSSKCFWKCRLQK